MSIFAYDDFTGANWSGLHNRNAVIGGKWVKNPSYSGTWYLWNNMVHCGIAGANYAGGVPSDPDYEVECDYRVYTTGGVQGIAGRMSTSAKTMYYVYYSGPDGMWVLAKWVSGVVQGIGYYVTGISAGGTVYKLRLGMNGTTITVHINDVERINVTDASITSAGRAGVVSGSANDRNIGKHIDNFTATDSGSPTGTTASITGLIGL
jgi:hypothetical protein